MNYQDVGNQCHQSWPNVGLKTPVQHQYQMKFHHAAPELDIGSLILDQSDDSQRPKKEG